MVSGDLSEKGLPNGELYLKLRILHTGPVDLRTEASCRIKGRRLRGLATLFGPSTEKSDGEGVLRIQPDQGDYKLDQDNTADYEEDSRNQAYFASGPPTEAVKS